MWNQWAAWESDYQWADAWGSIGGKPAYDDWGWPGGKPAAQRKGDAEDHEWPSGKGDVAEPSRQLDEYDGFDGKGKAVEPSWKRAKGWPAEHDAAEEQSWKRARKGDGGPDEHQSSNGLGDDASDWTAAEKGAKPKPVVMPPRKRVAEQSPENDAGHKPVAKPPPRKVPPPPRARGSVAKAVEQPVQEVQLDGTADEKDSPAEIDKTTREDDVHPLPPPPLPPDMQAGSRPEQYQQDSEDALRSSQGNQVGSETKNPTAVGQWATGFAAALQARLKKARTGNDAAEEKATLKSYSKACPPSKGKGKSISPEKQDSAIIPQDSAIIPQDSAMVPFQPAPAMNPVLDHGSLTQQSLGMEPTADDGFSEFKSKAFQLDASGDNRTMQMQSRQIADEELQQMEAFREEQRRAEAEFVPQRNLQERRFCPGDKQEYSYSEFMRWAPASFGSTELARRYWDEQMPPKQQAQQYWDELDAGLSSGPSSPAGGVAKQVGLPALADAAAEKKAADPEDPVLAALEADLEMIAVMGLPEVDDPALPAPVPRLQPCWRFTLEGFCEAGDLCRDIHGVDEDEGAAKAVQPSWNFAMAGITEAQLAVQTQLATAGIGAAGMPAAVSGAAEADPMGGWVRVPPEQLELMAGTKEAFNYKTMLCRHLAQIGKCGLGAKCRFAHSDEEIMQPGEMQRIARQMQAVPPCWIALLSGQGDQRGAARLKTEICRHFERTGFCSRGEECNFAHGMEELGVVPVPTHVKPPSFN